MFSRLIEKYRDSKGFYDSLRNVGILLVFYGLNGSFELPEAFTTQRRVFNFWNFFKFAKI